MAYYQNAVYRAKGGSELVVESSGTLTVKSGGAVAIDSGSTVTFSGATAVASGGSITVASGGTLNIDSGGISFCDPQTLTSATVATTMTPSGATFLTGTTTGPTYLLPTPVAGYAKDLVLIATSSGVTHRAVVYCNSTGRTIGNIAGDVGNTMTFATSACTAARLVASSSLAWRLVGYAGAAVPALSNKAT